MASRRTAKIASGTGNATAGERIRPYGIDAPARPSVIGSNLRVQGNLISCGEVRIYGTIEGDVQATNFVLGEKGTVAGNVIADTIDVHGFVHGDITGRNVKLKATAHVIGDTTHEVISVEKGACLDGNFKRTRQDQVGPGMLPNNSPAGLRWESETDDA